MDGIDGLGSRGDWPGVSRGWSSLAGTSPCNERIYRHPGFGPRVFGPELALFMGDVGGTCLGFLLGWLLTDAAANGRIAAAIILPMFFILDSTMTLVPRAWLRKPLATAHRDHAYQHAVDRGIRQDSVVLIVLTLGCLLIGLAAASPPATIPTTLASAALTFLLIGWMGWAGAGPARTERP